MPQDGLVDREYTPFRLQGLRSKKRDLQKIAANIVLMVAFWVMMSALLSGCASRPPVEKAEPSTTTPEVTTDTQEGRYKGKPNDWGPEQEIDMSHVPDAVPRYEERTQAGNKNPYTVLGQTYYLMDDERAYKQRGIASWYGYKFNGERTSNGELYDMFSMTGAHKTLPIPSYVRVTNLENRKSVVVRINDRGPFHEDRIIDLSYAAAQRLGITRAGTGNVEIEVVVPEDDPRPPLKSRKQLNAAKAPNTPKPADSSAKSAGLITAAEAGINGTTGKIPDGTYLQIGAFTVESFAKQFATSVGAKVSAPVSISTAKGTKKLYRVRVGPFKDTQSLEEARQQLQKIHILQTHVVYE